MTKGNTHLAMEPVPTRAIDKQKVWNRVDEATLSFILPVVLLFATSQEKKWN